VHQVDLVAGLGADAWPADFVASELDLAVAGLGSRLADGTVLRLVATDGLGEWSASGGDSGEGAAVVEAVLVEAVLVEAPGAQLLAWLLGRPSTVADPPEIGPWQ
jgi:hypothetical protein